MNDFCELLHKWFNSLRRFRFPFDHEVHLIPRNGIYVIFENGETFNDFDRIVRIGTHTGNNQLQSRLNQHFINDNKDRSIFRKNIGRCYLNLENRSYGKIWEIDFTSKAQREMHGHMRDELLERQIESKISTYIRNNLSFTVFEVVTKEQRLNFEARIVATICSCKECAPSEKWLGLTSPKTKIRESGLWQVQGLDGEQLRGDEMKELEKIFEEGSNATTS